LLGAAGTASAADFYEGKTISIMVSGGGTYDYYARMLTRVMPRYIPGKPNMIVKEMIGAGGLRAANYIANVAPKDGTEIAGVHGHIPTIPFFQPQGAQYDPTKLSWIGSATQEVYMGYVWNTSPVQSFRDAQIKEAVVGGGALGTASVDIPVLANEMAGTKFRVITGYATSRDIQLAVERGELNGHLGTTWTNILSGQPEWLKGNKIKVIAQFGKTKHPELMSVPLLTEFVPNPEDRKALEVFLSRQDTGKPYFAPPGIPKDRLDILRKAFDAAIKDPDFLADAEKAKLDVVGPMTGQQIEGFLAETFKSPPAYAKRINDIFDEFSKTH
jgi:tripartite-type tricarboxylate transporter receptor subunit TctC